VDPAPGRVASAAVEISYCTLDDVAEQTGTVVVIDVLRAFTTAAVALAAGAGPYRLVATLEEAHAARAADPAVRLLGEVDGYTAEGFDFGNSQTELEGIDLTGVAIVHRSSAGTQGVVRATRAGRILAASFAVAGATARALAGDDRVSFCVTGAHSGRDGEEDRACGEYVAALLMAGGPVDPAPYVARVPTSTAGRLFGVEGLPAADVPHAQVVDRFDFALAVDRVDDQLLLRRLRV
jgi:2-phosphosulfolactate phosphatase